MQVLSWHGYMLWLVTGSLLFVRHTSAAYNFNSRERSNSASSGFFEDGAKWNARSYTQKAVERNFEEPEMGTREPHVDKFLDRLTLILNSRPTNTSTRCQRDIYRTQRGIKNGKTWALSMIDSFGKPGSGIFEGNVFWPGSFSQCRSVKSGDDNAEHGSNFSGFYCWLNLKPVPNNLVKDPLWRLMTVKIGTCFPDSCSEEELSQLIQDSGLLRYIEDYLELNDISCIVPRPNIWEDPKALVALVIILLFALLMAVGTVYDLKMDHSSCGKRRIHHSGFSKLQALKKLDEIKHCDDSDACNNTETTTNNDEPEKNSCGTGSRLLLAFSVRRNGKSLFRLSDGKDSLPVLNGIRVFSLLWIVLVHTWFLLIKSRLVDNIKTFAEYYEGYFVQHFIIQTIGVDSFFVLSALLVTYNYLKKRKKGDNKSWARFYIDRYFRLTITYATVMFLIHGHLWMYLGDGPFWTLEVVGTEACYQNWWKNLLYINNFFQENNVCMAQSWYLAVDMQFFFLSPLFLIAMERYRFLAVSLFATFMAATWTTTLVIASIVKPHIYFNLKTFSVEHDTEVYNRTYVTPYTRFVPYLVGMICGWVLHQTQRKVVMKKKWVFIGWVVAANCLLNVLFNTAIDGLNFNILYTTFSRTIWAIGVSWIIFACCNGYGGIVTKFLNIPLWNVMGRLTYCAYLVHFNIVIFFYVNTDVLYHFEGGTPMTYKFITHVVCAYMLAVVVYLAVEAPLTIVQKMIFP